MVNPRWTHCSASRRLLLVMKMWQAVSCSEVFPDDSGVANRTFRLFTTESRAGPGALEEYAAWRASAWMAGLLSVPDASARTLS